MALFIKAGVLARDSSYYGQGTVIPSKFFETSKMRAIQFGFLEPPTDSGVGTPSSTLDTVEATSLSGAKIGAWFFYTEGFNRDVKYFITCNSSGGSSLGAASALTSVNPNDVATVAVATGSGYILAS